MTDVDVVRCRCDRDELRTRVGVHFRQLVAVQVRAVHVIIGAPQQLVTCRNNIKPSVLRTRHGKYDSVLNRTLNY